MWINDEDIYIRNTTKTILFNNENINIFYLSELLNLPETPKEQNSKKTVVILEIENSMIGIVVDKILGDQNILQKKLEPPILKLKNISGITTLATGEVCLILNIIELYKSTYSPVEKPLIKINDENKKIKKSPKILIVDDSVTTRNLLKNVLTHNNYQFEMVHNPKEALLLLEYKDFDLILSDMEMPEMNGKMFVETLKSQEKYHNIPIIIISSYDADSLKEEIPKANAIIPKAKFNQQYLLKTIENLINND
jgi:two-component system chemotaxis sensor kinase CheA